MAYIIMGGGGGSTETSNIKYDPDEDKLYLYDGNTWRYWRRGGLKTLWLYDNGTDYTEVTGGWTSTATISSMDKDGTIYATNFSNGKTIRNNYLIDAKGHTKFHVSYQEYDYAANWGFRLCNSTGTILYSKTHSHSVSAWQWQSGEWDVGVSLGDTLVYFEVYHSGSYTGQLKLGDIRFYTPDNE